MRLPARCAPVRTILLFAALLSCSLQVATAVAPRPNLSGFWSLSRSKPVKDPALLAKIAPNTVILDDTGRWNSA